jgi:4'-phosphopantetheinyl transferase EntD
MIERILPAPVACADTFGDPPGAVLFPEEEAVISRAVEKRRREFRTVRHCARDALGKLGLPPAALLPGERGAPQWPPEVVGSMTHCAGYRAAAVGRSHELLTLGIDAEPHDVLPPDVLGYIALDEEQAHLAELTAAHRGICWDRLLFCAKEAVYKAWFPLTRRWLGFEQAAVTIDPGPAGPAEGRFTVRLLVPGPVVGSTALTGFDGRWLVGDGLMLTAIAVPGQVPSGPRDAK